MLTRKIAALFALFVLLVPCSYAFATAQTAFDFPNVDASDKHMRMLFENSLSYIDPAHEMTEPVSGYPVEGWNHDPEKGLYLRAFTQLTAIGEWLELMANISAGYADNPYLSREQALAQALHITKSLIEDQNNPDISAKGLLVNFLGLENGKRIGPMARDIEKETIVEEFGQSRGEEIWDALLEIEWLKPQRQGQLGIVLRSSEYGTEYFEGPLEPFSDKPTKERIMDLLDRRVVQIIFGDNSNLSACVGKAIGCFLSPSIKDRPEVVKMRRQLEGFLEA